MKNSAPRARHVETAGVRHQVRICCNVLPLHRPPSAVRRSPSSGLLMFVHLHLHTEYSLVDSVVRIQSEPGCSRVMEQWRVRACPLWSTVEQHCCDGEVTGGAVDGHQNLSSCRLLVARNGIASSLTLGGCCAKQCRILESSRLITRAYLQGQACRAFERIAMIERCGYHGSVAGLTRCRRARV